MWEVTSKYFFILQFITMNVNGKKNLLYLIVYYKQCEKKISNSIYYNKNKLIAQ